MKKAGLSVYPLGTANYVIAHARYQRSRGRKPSMSFMTERNPAKALRMAEKFLGWADDRAVYQEAACEILRAVDPAYLAEDLAADEIERLAVMVICDSGTENEVVRRLEQLGCIDVNVTSDMPDDKAGQEAAELVRALGGPVLKSGALVYCSFMWRGEHVMM